MQRLASFRLNDGRRGSLCNGSRSCGSRTGAIDSVVSVRILEVLLNHRKLRGLAVRVDRRVAIVVLLEQVREVVENRL